MGSSENKQGAKAAAGCQFRTTRWTRVCKARNLETPSAVEALSQLCREYWYPLYAFVRRRGYSPEDGEDLTQSFFARLLDKQYLQRADPGRGRFRTFLLKSLDHFLVNEWEKQKTIKRGGHCLFVSWEELKAEDRYSEEPYHELSPDKLYDRRWAMALIEKAMEVLRQEYAVAGEQAVFEALQGFLSGGESSDSHKHVAARLSLTEDAIKMRLHRLKRRFGVLLREVVADTVSEEGEIDDEMRYLLAVWN